MCATTGRLNPPPGTNSGHMRIAPAAAGLVFTSQQFRGLRVEPGRWHTLAFITAEGREQLALLELVEHNGRLTPPGLPSAVAEADG